MSFKPPNKTLISNVTGKPWGEAQLSADYWVGQLRGAVRFADGIAYAQSKKFQTFVEIGPKPTLLGLGRACFSSDDGTWLPGLKPDKASGRRCSGLLQNSMCAASISTGIAFTRETDIQTGTAAQLSVALSTLLDRCRLDRRKWTKASSACSSADRECQSTVSSLNQP